MDEDKDSEVSFGGLNKDRFIGDVHWSDVIEDKSTFYWLINIDDILYNNRSLGLCKNGCKAAVDTGTTLLTAPSDSVNKLFNALDFDCSDYKTAPNITFVINGKNFDMSPQDYILTESI